MVSAVVFSLSGRHEAQCESGHDGRIDLELTDVAAKDDDTGAADRGGDCELEYTTGLI